MSSQRLRNTLAFFGSVLGAVLLISGLVALGIDDRGGWLPLPGAAFAFVLAFAPGRILRAKYRPPDA